MATDVMSSSSATSTREFEARGLFVGAAVGGVLGAIGNLAVYFGARAAGVDFLGSFQGPAITALPVGPVIGASLVPALVGALVLLGMNAFLRNAGKIFVVLSVLLTVVSMGGPMSIAHASMGTKLALCAMHVVSALTITIGLLRFGRKR